MSQLPAYHSHMSSCHLSPLSACHSHMSQLSACHRCLYVTVTCHSCPHVIVTCHSCLHVTVTCHSCQHVTCHSTMSQSHVTDVCMSWSHVTVVSLSQLCKAFLLACLNTFMTLLGLLCTAAYQHHHKGQFTHNGLVHEWLHTIYV